MSYCHNCGEKLPKDALFCPKCGTKSIQSGEATAPRNASEEMRDAFNKMSQEMEKAFNIAAKEIQQAFQTARANVQKSVYGEPIPCPNCGERNPSSALYCFKCGNKLPEKQAENKQSK